MSYPFDDHDDNVDEFYQFQNKYHFCVMWTFSDSIRLHYLLFFSGGVMLYNRELDKSLFNSEKSQRIDPTANYFDACV